MLSSMYTVSSMSNRLQECYQILWSGSPAQSPSYILQAPNAVDVTLGSPSHNPQSRQFRFLIIVGIFSSNQGGLFRSKSRSRLRSHPLHHAFVVECRQEDHLSLSDSECVPKSDIWSQNSPPATSVAACTAMIMVNRARSLERVKCILGLEMVLGRWFEFLPSYISYIRAFNPCSRASSTSRIANLSDGTFLRNPHAYSSLSLCLSEWG
jgi:hypothetical protein